MNATLFRRFCSIAMEKAGLNMKPGKEALVAARVARRIRALELDSPAAYLDYLESEKTGKEMVLFLDAITTNFTHFFREQPHFDYLSRWTRGRVAAGERKLRIWSAAASTGEEPYSIAMTLLDAVEHQNVDVRILATDLSTQALQVAREGAYSRDRLKPVPPSQRARYFDERFKGQTDADTSWVVRPEVREMLVFARLNLSRPPFPMQGPFDIVFCRNVMIYFPENVRRRLVHEIERLLRPGGVLMIGHTETLGGLNSSLKRCQPAIYAKPLEPGGHRDPY
jgi:chemotaxis protein methyltransferase CheR